MDNKRPQSRNGLGRAVAPIALALGLTACIEFPDPPPDDEGHASFAREATVVLLGRRAHGVDEVEALADISQLLGRDVVVEMLMRDEAFIDHWTAAIIDILEMQRDSQGGTAAQDSDCWGPPTRTEPDPAIAEWVRDHGPNDAGAPTPAWNMTDLVRSAIAIDDLSVIHRANLFTLSMRRAGGDQRAAVAGRFLATYLNRDVTCLRCHNPTFSTSNKTDPATGEIVWRRLWTILGHPEKALFGDYYDAATVLDRLYPIMQPDVRQPASGSFGIQPWGISTECAFDTTSPAASNAGTVTHEGFQTVGLASNPDAGFGSLDGAVTPTVALWELEDSLRQGILDLKDGYERFDAATPLLPPDEQLFCDAVVAMISAHGCAGCHFSGGNDLNLAAEDLGPELIGVPTFYASSTQADRVVPGAGNAAVSEFYQRIASTDPAYQMSPGPVVVPAATTVTQTEIDLVEDWIDAGAPTISTENCNTSDIPDVEPDEAFAFLTASHLVDGIWTAAMGYPLTIDHGYPRNEDQRDALWDLTELTFLPADWSLKSVLTKILASNWIARRAPTISQQDTAYKLHPVIDPWIVADPTEEPNPSADQEFNGQGELVDRYRVNTVLRTLAAALGWEEPRTFPDGVYPSPLDEALGQYLSPDAPGFSGIGFQALLALEAEAGLCVKTGHAVGADDWIDRLIDEIDAHNGANPDAPITLGEAWSLLKDRLTQDPTIETVLPVDLAADPNAKTEEQALVALLNEGLAIPGGLDLNSATGALSPTQLDDKLREACGVLVKSPQFLLSNLTPRGYSDNDMPDPPRLSVCLDGEACGYAGNCAAWTGVLLGMGQFVTCEDRSVRSGLPLLDLIDRFPIVPFPELGPVIRPAAAPSSGAERRRPSDSASSGEDSKDRRALAALRMRVAALCPRGICGFVKRPRVADCRRRPSRSTCQAMLPPCDPRHPDRLNFCGRPPADVREPGVLVAWTEGARVSRARGVRRLRHGEWQWAPLEAGARLQAGELLDVPLDAALELDLDGRRFGVRRLDRRQQPMSGGHLIAVTGPSVEKFLKLPPKDGALSPAELSEGLASGRFESRGATKEDWRRVLRYGPRTTGQETPTRERIRAINADLEALHTPEELEALRRAGVRPERDDRQYR